jgi:hypothetical protein
MTAIKPVRNLRRFTEHRPPGKPYTLAPDHHAVQRGVSLFHNGRWSDPRFDEASLLKRGHNNRKIGDRVTKGRWFGKHIYTLTLEERATCPVTCAHWEDCYGNKMNWPTRWAHGFFLEQRLDDELRTLARKHPSGYVIRLHVLGDFYSPEYVNRWRQWLKEIPELNVYGYTAWKRGTAIGDAVIALRDESWDRFAVRLSNADESDAATATVYETQIRGRREGGIVCPAQSNDAECCATCGLCWQVRTNIVFMAH